MPDSFRENWAKTTALTAPAWCSSRFRSIIIVLGISHNYRFSPACRGAHILKRYGVGTVRLRTACTWPAGAAGQINVWSGLNFTGNLWTGVGAAIMGLLGLAQRSLSGGRSIRWGS